MILPIYLYGQPVLREVAKDINSEYPKLSQLIADMFETMQNANGIGLAAPQIGLHIRLFVIDLDPLAEDEPEFKGFRKVFINPQITARTGDIVKLEEGCLSIPGIHEAVERESTIHIDYLDENFNAHSETYSDFFARVIQHEYDHIEGKLFIDKITPIRKQLIKAKLTNLLKGKANCAYRVKAINK